MACEIIVVDNASSDNTLELLRRHHHLRLVENSSNLGYARANNQGIKLATGEYVLLLNPDTRTELGALDAIFGAAEVAPKGVMRGLEW